METLKKIVKNQYFPAAAVLVAVLLFWAAGLMGGLSMLNDNNPPIATLTWMLFVYAAAVLTPLAGLLAAVDLVRRWLRNRNAVQVGPALVEQVHAGRVTDTCEDEPAQAEPPVADVVHVESVQVDSARNEPQREEPPQNPQAQAKQSRKKAA